MPIPPALIKFAATAATTYAPVLAEKLLDKFSEEHVPDKPDETRGEEMFEDWEFEDLGDSLKSMGKGIALNALTSLVISGVTWLGKKLFERFSSTNSLAVVEVAQMAPYDVQKASKQATQHVAAHYWSKNESAGKPRLAITSRA